MDNMELKDYRNAAITTTGEVEGTHFRLEKFTAMARCTNCQRDGYTKVKSKISGVGMVWAMCCCFGCFLPSLLVFCMDEFREFRHYCPFCNTMVGAYTPNFSAGRFFFLLFLTIGVSIGIGIGIAILFMFYVASQVARH